MTDAEARELRNRIHCLYLEVSPEIVQDILTAAQRVIERADAAEQDAVRLRELLWLYHGCPSPALYGDDGEMQCGACVIDFRRNTVETIRARWEAKARAALTAARGEPPDGR